MQVVPTTTIVYPPLGNCVRFVFSDSVFFVDLPRHGTFADLALRLNDLQLGGHGRAQSIDVTLAKQS